MSRQYASAARAVTAVVDHGASLKAHCNRHRMGKVDYALACETLKHAELLGGLLTTAGLSAESLDVGNSGLLLVMIYELLLGQGKIQGGGAVKRKLMEHRDRLAALLAEETARRGGVAHLLPAAVAAHAALPKYGRVNGILVPGRLEEEVQALRTQLETELGVALEVDKHIPSLLVFPPQWAGLGRHPLVCEQGRLILQDKASCFPSQVLGDARLALGLEAGDVLDACAAPGNKTSHVAAFVAASNAVAAKTKAGSKRPPNSVWALDKNPRRAELLATRMRQAGGEANGLVRVANEDFLAIDPADSRFARVQAVLLDPSCSGSGVVRALERVVTTARTPKYDEAERLDQLSSFQIAAIQKAMSFPQVQLIVYSTCSIHEEENEHVVNEILKHSKAHGDQWTLDAPQALADWPRRGQVTQPENATHLSSADQAKLVRCLPEDGMNGFFVALFVRKSLLKRKRKAPEPEPEPEPIAEPVAEPIAEPEPAAKKVKAKPQPKPKAKKAIKRIPLRLSWRPIHQPAPTMVVSNRYSL